MHNKNNNNNFQVIIWNATNLPHPQSKYTESSVDRLHNVAGGFSFGLYFGKFDESAKRVSKKWGGLGEC